MYVFPGLGLGAIAAKATGISDRMMMTAAETVSKRSASSTIESGILPALEDVDELSGEIAVAVALVAMEEGLAPEATSSEIEERIASYRWTPEYPTIGEAG